MLLILRNICALAGSYATATLDVFDAERQLADMLTICYAIAMLPRMNDAAATAAAMFSRAAATLMIFSILFSLRFTPAFAAATPCRHAATPGRAIIAAADVP